MVNQQQQLKTGTTTVAIRCKDGVVLAADKRVTAGYQIMNKKFVKVVPLTDHMAITTAGLVSDAQLLARLARAEIQLKTIQTKRKTTVKETAYLLGSLSYSNFRKFSAVQGVVGFMLGGADTTGHYIYDVGIDGSLTEVDNFMSDGSGSVYALGVLETLYKEDMTIDEGVSLAVKAVNAALQRDIASGNGIDVIAITQDGLKQVLQKTVNTGLTQ